MIAPPAIPWHPFDGCAFAGQNGPAVDAWYAWPRSPFADDPTHFAKVDGMARAWLFRGPGWVATVILDASGRLANFTWRAE